MRLHQVLTGAANTSENGASVGYGCIEDYPFIVYSSGCDVVILDSKFQRVQIVTRQCPTSNHVGLISCSETDGKIAVAYSTKIRVFAPHVSAASTQNKSLPFEWSLVSEFSTRYALNCLVWDRDGKRLLTGGELLELWIELVEEKEHREKKLTWKNLWHCETSTPVHHVQFSSDGSYFASLGKNDCLVKVWFEIEEGNPLLRKRDSNSAFYDFLYIPHPRPVTGFSWRKTSPFMPRNCVANVLLTSCVDNVCRIWCETMEQKAVSEFAEDQYPNSGHNERQKSIPKPAHVKNGPPSLRSFDLQSDHHFHIAASIDPSKDIPIMSTVSFFTAAENHSSFALHWINNKEMFFTAVANLLLGSPSVAVDAESVSSELSVVSSKIDDSPYDILDEEEIEAVQIVNGSYEDQEQDTPMVAYPSNQDDRHAKNPHGHSMNLLSKFGMLIREWQKSTDSLLAINPADGSLLVWLVESLDVSLGSDFRQTQVSFSSCIPSVFPSADAHSLLQNLILYRLPGKLNMQAYSPAELLSVGFYSHGRATKTSTLPQSSANISLVSVETGAHPPAAMISTHKDGSMNQWQVDFADNTAFSTLISLSHLTRLSGHRFPLAGMFPHPSLPLMLSVSTFTAPHDDVEEHADTREQSSFSFSELILWQCESVFPLSQNGGIMELAKITSTAPNAFDKIAWLPKLFINSLLTFDSSVLLSPRSVSPCACFVASDDTGLRFYQVVLDGRALLDFLSGKQNYRRGLERVHSFGSEDGEDPDTNYPAVSSVPSLLHCIVSDQSGAKPGSVLKLCRLKQSRNALRDPLFLHVFSEHAVTEGGIYAKKCSLSSEDRWSEDIFYLVALENEQEIGYVRTIVHMWRIEITTSSDDNDIESSTEGVLSPNELLSPSNVSSCTEMHESVKCGIRSRKVLTSQLNLPEQVHVTMAATSANTLSAVSENRSCSLPYLFATTCSDGELRFWTCEVKSTKNSSSRSYIWRESGIRTNGVSNSVVKTTTRIDGVPVCIDCANTGRVAVVFRTNDCSRGEARDSQIAYHVAVWESESSGNTQWVLEESFSIEDNLTSLPTKHTCVRWFSCENGSFVLMVGIGRVFHLYSLLGSKGNENFQPDIKGGISNHRYEELERIEAHGCSTSNQEAVFVSFVRRGLLVVGVGYEVHVYSQWEDKKLKDGEGGVLVPCVDELRSPGLFNQVRRRNPTLPQYHPKYLMELLDFGKIRRVRAILNHLVRCVAGYEATQAAVCNDGENSRSRTRSVISTLSRTTSLSSTPVETFAKGDTSHHSTVDCIPPIPISDLLAADKDDSGNVHKHTDSPVVDENPSPDATEEKDYSELFTSSLKGSFDSSEEGEHPLILLVKHTVSPVHFGLAQAGLLSEHLSKKQLPGLTRTEQLELQALADTLATTKTDLEESSSKIDRGLKFARKNDTANDRVTGLMGGPGGGGGGYATTGSIGATEGSGGDAVDECGLRFLLAMRHHTCLLRSLPLVPRAKLEQKGLSTSKFVWAFHSDTQEELLAMLPGMIRGEPTWQELRQYGVGWWIKSNETLRRLIEKVAKAQFNSKQDPMDCSLFYMAMKKKSVLRGLFRTQGDSRMATFFGHNFNEERWRKAALKNAYSLLSKQRFEHAAAFFLLAGALWDAVRLCISRLKDVQLALVISRLYENEVDNLNYKRILTECVLGSDEETCEANKDPFLRSISYWLVKKCHKALHTLLLEPSPNTDHVEGKYNALAATGSPDIFNFYVYLRTHPLLRRSIFQNDAKVKTSRLRRKVFKITHEKSLSEAVMLPSPLTPFERRLYFMTAHNHYNAGCPDLSLQVLLDLPPPSVENCSDQMKYDGASSTDEIDQSSPDKNENMINTGTLDVDWSKLSSSKVQGSEMNSNSSDFDWSQPVSSKLGGPGPNNSSSSFDWGQPVSSLLGGSGPDGSNSSFDWSQPVSSKMGGSGFDDDSSNFDWSKPVSSKFGGHGVENSVDFEWSQPISTKLEDSETIDGHLWSAELSEKSSKSEDVSSAVTGCPDSTVEGEPVDKSNSDESNAEGTPQNADAVSQRLKFRACLKLVVEEMCTLPHHCQIHNKDLRSTFNAWLKKELDLIHRLCDYEGDKGVTDALVPLKLSTPTTLEAASEEVFTDLAGDSSNEKKNFAQKVEISAKHIEWLRKNQGLLNILLNYCTLHGASGGDVATMKLELLILIHELEQQRHLMSPLYLRSAGSSIPPLILATMASTFSLGASPFTYLSSMTQDILKHLTKLPGPPSPSQPLAMVSVLRSMSATLSACVFQSLVCGKDDGDTSTLDPSHSSHSTTLLQGGPSPIHHRSDVSLGSVHKLKPTSSPNKWPGVRLLRSLLITEAKDNATKLKVLLCEICVSIYLSLLSIAWCENDPNQLYYIISNRLTAEMWGETFGGGHKVKDRTPLSQDESRRQSASPTGQTHGTYWEAARRRWNYKLLQAPAKETKLEKKTIEHEEFIPPQLSLMEYFLRKPKVDHRMALIYDSEASITSESEESDDAFENDETIVQMKKKKVKPLDHLDPKSFPWKLMNYAVSTLVCRNLTMFLADVGLEVSDLPTVSPLLHSATKMLQHWKQVLFSKLKTGAPPPLDYIDPFTIIEDDYPRGGPTLMKYKALRDAGNTPFRSTSTSANPAKRLWYTLVHKEELQEIFLEFVFGRGDQPIVKVDQTNNVDGRAKILYKDSEAINAFCISKTNAMHVVVATIRDVQEIDISSLLGSSRTCFIDENDPPDPEKRMGDQDEFITVFNGTGSETGQSQMLAQNISGQSGTGSSVIMKRNVSGVKRMEEHPNLPYYLTGGHDGSLRMWEFGHEPEIATYREGGKYQRVTKVHFSQHGSKFGVMDFGGQLALYQSVNASKTKAFTTLKCHNKQGNDFAFLGSTSLLATAGLSSDGNSVCLWDTLLPPPGSLIHAFACHDNGAASVVYVNGKRLLLSGGRKGNICIYDLRQRQLIQTFTAHDSDVKSIAVDESEEFFVTGSLDGDIKVWNLSAHEELLSFPGEHGKSNYQFIKLGTQGVPRICIKPGGQMFSCGGDGTLKWHQLPMKNLIVNSPF